MDVNGDGLADAVQTPNFGGNISVAINTGRDFLPPVAYALPPGFGVGQAAADDVVDANGNGTGRSVDPGIRVMDYDFDGRADLFLMDGGCINQANPASTFPTTRSHPAALMFHGGGALSSASYTGAPVGNAGAAQFDGQPIVCPAYGNSRVLDANGDGLPDFVQIEGTTQPRGSRSIFAQGDPAGPPNVIKTITDSLGHQTGIEYKPITDPVHTKVSCSYPQSCNPRGMWVVSKQTMDVTGSPLVYTHAYQGARTDLQGIGWLGMDSHTVTDAQTDPSGASLTTTTYVRPHVQGRIAHLCVCR